MATMEYSFLRDEEILSNEERIVLSEWMSDSHDDAEEKEAESASPKSKYF